MRKFFVIVTLLAIVHFVITNGVSCEETVPAINSSPHTISLHKRIGTNKNVGVCAGSIISKEWVVTAASCITDPTDLRSYYILSGTNDRTKGGTIHEISDIVVHERAAKVNSAVTVNDIALIKVRKTFALGESRRAATLSNEILPTENMPVSVTGWGTSKTSRKVPTLLQSLPEKILSISACQKYYKPRIPENQFCTSHTKNKYFHKHELGNPIIVDDRLIGIGTWSSTVRPYTGKPNVFIDISKYRNWIELKMLEHDHLMKFVLDQVLPRS